MAASYRSALVLVVLLAWPSLALAQGQVPAASPLLARKFEEADAESFLRRCEFSQSLHVSHRRLGPECGDLM